MDEVQKLSNHNCFTLSWNPVELTSPFVTCHKQVSRDRQENRSCLTTKIRGIWNGSRCSSWIRLRSYRHRGTMLSRRWIRNISENRPPQSSAVNTEVVCSSKTLVYGIFKSTRRHNPILQNRQRVYGFCLSLFCCVWLKSLNNQPQRW